MAQGPPRPHGPAAEGLRLPVPQRHARRAAAPDDQRPAHARALGRYLSDHRLVGAAKETIMSTATPSTFKATPAKDLGYTSFGIGEFKFSRDEYFATIEYPGGRH